MTSASFWMGARLRWASATMRTICARRVSAPTFSALMMSEPVPFTVAPTTRSPCLFSTGIGSPVIMDSSTALAPSVTIPSTGIFSPGRTLRISPACTCSRGISSSAPSLTRRAVFGARPRSILIAAPVRDGLPPAHEKGPTAPEHDGRGENELQPFEDCPGNKPAGIDLRDVTAHGDNNQRYRQDRTYPKAPRHVDEFGILFLFERDGPGFERHAADGTASRSVPHDLGVHGAGVLRRALGSLEGRLFAQERFGDFVEVLLARLRTEVVCLALVRGRRRGFLGLNGHLADGINDLHRFLPAPKMRMVQMGFTPIISIPLRIFQRN